MTGIGTGYTEVKVQEENGELLVQSPYCQEFVWGARRIGGRWDKGLRAWRFAEEQRGLVRDLLIEVYGFDPFGDAGEPVTVRWAVAEPIRDQALWGCGRFLLEREGRDAPVRFGRHVVLVSGGFARSGGSRKYPCIGTPEDGTVIEIKNVPLEAAERFVQKYGGEIVKRERDDRYRIGRAERLVLEALETLADVDGTEQARADLEAALEHVREAKG